MLSKWNRAENIIEVHSDIYSIRTDDDDGEEEVIMPPFYWYWIIIKHTSHSQNTKYQTGFVFNFIYMAITENGPHSLSFFYDYFFNFITKKTYATIFVAYPTQSIGAGGYANVL